MGFSLAFVIIIWLRRLGQMPNITNTTEKLDCFKDMRNSSRAFYSGLHCSSAKFSFCLGYLSNEVLATVLHNARSLDHLEYPTQRLTKTPFIFIPLEFSICKYLA